MPDVREMLGKEVEVIANGVSYTGTLVEVSDAEIHLKTMLQWVSLPASSVMQVRVREQARQAAADSIEVRESLVDVQAADDAETVEQVEEL